MEVVPLKAIVIVCTLLCAGALFGADQPQYGPVTVVGASDSERVAPATRELVSGVTAGLRSDRQIIVVESGPIGYHSPTPEELLRISRDRKAPWVALIDSRAGDGENDSSFSVQVMHVKANAIDTFATVFISKLTAAAAATRTAVTGAISAIVQEISQHQRVWVQLMLYTTPPQAFFSLEGSSQQRTDASGYGCWCGVRPLGIADLSVTLPGKKPYSREIPITRPVTDSMNLSITVTLEDINSPRQSTGR